MAGEVHAWGPGRAEVGVDCAPAQRHRFPVQPRDPRHQWTPLNPTDPTGADPLAVQGIPGVGVPTFTLAMDANDMIADWQHADGRYRPDDRHLFAAGGARPLLYPITDSSGDCSARFRPRSAHRA